MIVREFYETREDGVNLYHIYSDSNFYIIQSGTNAKYADVIDVEDAPYEYTESDEEIPEESKPDDPVYPEPEPGPEPVEPEPTSIEGRKILKKMQIDEYDQSPNVNGFYLGDQLMWLDRETRASLRNTIESLMLLGRTELDIWYGTTRITLDVNTAKQLLAVLEVYATDCYNVTIQHKIAVDSLTDIDEVINFDITANYPEMPHFPLS